MVYNLSLINGSGITPLIKTVNDNLMFGWYGNLILIAVFAILYLGFSKHTQNDKYSIAVASFITAISSVIFIALGVIPFVTLITCWVIAALTISLLFFSSD